MQSTWACCTLLRNVSGKWTGNDFEGHRSFRKLLRAQEDFIAAATTNERVPIIEGVLEGNAVHFMIDSGSAVSLVAKAALPLNSPIRMENARQLWTADGHKMGVMGTARLAVQLGEYRAVHEFLVAEELLMPVIIGVDFLSRHSVILDYSNNQTVRIRIGAETIHTRADTTKHNSSTCYTACTVAESEGDTIEECAVPQFGKGPVFDIPSCMPELSGVIERYKHHFQQFLVLQTWHSIPLKLLTMRLYVFLHDEFQHTLGTKFRTHCKICLLETSLELAAAHGLPLQCTSQRRMVTYVSA